jgi:hypothetical protein
MRRKLIVFVLLASVLTGAFAAGAREVTCEAKQIRVLAFKDHIDLTCGPETVKLPLRRLAFAYYAHASALSFDAPITIDLDTMRIFVGNADCEDAGWIIDPQHIVLILQGEKPHYYFAKDGFKLKLPELKGESEGGLRTLVDIAMSARPNAFLRVRFKPSGHDWRGDDDKDLGLDLKLFSRERFFEFDMGTKRYFDQAVDALSLHDDEKRLFFISADIHAQASKIIAGAAQGSRFFCKGHISDDGNWQMDDSHEIRECRLLGPGVSFTRVQDWERKIELPKPRFNDFGKADWVFPVVHLSKLSLQELTEYVRTRTQEIFLAHRRGNQDLWFTILGKQTYSIFRITLSNEMRKHKPLLVTGNVLIDSSPPSREREQLAYAIHFAARRAADATVGKGKYDAALDESTLPCSSALDPLFAQIGPELLRIVCGK